MTTTRNGKLKLACADFTFPLLPHDAVLDLIAALDMDGIDVGLFEGRSHLWPSKEFTKVAKSLNERKVIGRFSTFLEHVKTLKTGEQVTKYNALFHWAVPPGRELDAGREVGRFHIMTHAYWREAGEEAVRAGCRPRATQGSGNRQQG